MSNRATLLWLILTVAVGALVPAANALAGTPSSGLLTGPLGFGSALVGSAPVGTGPSELALDPATHTIYVANGINDNGAQGADGDTVSVIDARHCNAREVSRCAGPWPTITVGNLPGGIAIDRATDTVYVANVGDNTVSVFNGATCNALNTSGCGQTPATVPVGLGPIDLFADPANHTVYVANFDSPPLGDNNSTAVSMIDSATCNATDLSACPTTAPPTVDVGNPPDQVEVDQATHTAYVTTLSGWSVFDTNTCNATLQTGCAAIGYLSGDSAGPNDGQVDHANDTLYTANYDNTISAFDLHHCNAGDLAGCAGVTPGIVTFPYAIPYGGFDHALYVAVDQPLHTVYVSYQNDDTLAVVDTRACNGEDPGGCATLDPRAIHTGADPEGVILDASTQTLYTANEVGDDISVIDTLRCDAQISSGCRHAAPSVAVPGPGLAAVDQAVHTAYVPDFSGLAMIDTASCNAQAPGGCEQTPPQAVGVGHHAKAVAVDHRTGTVYVATFGSYSTPGPGTVSVLAAATCNATIQTGCEQAATLEVPGGNPVDIAVDGATDTIYVATITDSGRDLLSVFNGATCNATDTSGCDQSPAALPFGHSGERFGDSDLGIAVNPDTNTIYATNVVWSLQNSDSVDVFNGATCDASDTTGCDQTPATVTVGLDPRGLAVDRATDTIYVTNHETGDFLGNVSVINGGTCNGQDTGGCDQTPATTAPGFGVYDVAVDQRTDDVDVANSGDTSVSSIDGATCNALDISGCSQTPTESAVGNYPFSLAVDGAADTAYVSNYDNTVSVIPATP